MSDKKLRIGFIPLCDATSLLIAVDKGFAAAEGLDIELVREVSWANVRDKLKNLGADPFKITSAEFDARVRKEIETNTQVARAANIKVE